MRVCTNETMRKYLNDVINEVRIEVIKVIKFCEKCGSMMLPSKDKGFLECNLCDYRLQVSDSLRDDYMINTVIEHPKGKEYKNLKNMEIWKEKEITEKFKN